LGVFYKSMIMALKKMIKFDLNKRGSSEENLPIRMRITFSGQRLDIPIGYNIDRHNWDTKAHRVDSGCTNKLKQTSVEINRRIAERESAIERIFTRYELDGVTPTIEMVKNAYYAIYGKQAKPEDQKETSFFERFDEFVKDRGKNNDWTNATYTKFSAVRSHLEKFDPNLSFDALNEDKLLAYVNFLQEDKEKEKKDEDEEIKMIPGMRNTTISKQLGFLKWFLRWASSKGYNNQMAYENFTPKLKTVNKDIVFLDWTELMHLYSFSIPSTQQYLERVRDVFCFCCFTSLRYSDVYNLKRSDIKNGALHITTVKTDDKLIIELNKYSSAILNKYKGVAFEGDKALPVISNQKMNEYLKILGKLVKLNEPITDVYFKGNERKETIFPKWALLGTHAGRRTFICIALAMNIPAPVVMKWTGHSDYKAMQPYISVAEKVKANAMKKFNVK
jgi:integrase